MTNQNNDDIVGKTGDILQTAAADLPGKIAGKAVEAVGGVVLGSVVEKAVDSAVEAVGGTVLDAVGVQADDKDAISRRKYAVGTVTAQSSKSKRGRTVKKVVGTICSLIGAGVVYGSIALYQWSSNENARLAAENARVVAEVEVATFRAQIQRIYATIGDKPLLFEYNESPDRISKCTMRAREAEGKKYLEVECNETDITNLKWRAFDFVIGGVDRDFSSTIIEDYNLDGPDKNDIVRMLEWEEDSRDKAKETSRMRFSELTDAVQAELAQRYRSVVRRGVALLP